MRTIQFEIGKSYQLPVTEVVNINKKTFCKVEANGKLYPIQLYPFQQRGEAPKLIDCYVKDINHTDGEPILKQDTSVIIPQLYKKDHIYTFKARPLGNRRIEVVDENFLCFKIDTKKNVNYGSKVECRVTDYVNGKLQLEIVSQENNTNKLPFIPADSLREILHMGPQWCGRVMKICRSQERYRAIWELYEHEDEEWIIRLIDQLNRDRHSWVVNRRPGRGATYHKLALGCFQQLCSYLLEDTDVLLCCTESEREAYQATLTNANENATILIQAVELIEKQQQLDTVDRILGKINRSGYLIEPDKQLKLLMCLLTLNKSLMDEKMGRIFDIIINGKHNSWSHDPFRKAFVDMLELYIHQNAESVNQLTRIKTEEERKRHEKMVNALAIQLLLLNDKDDVDRQLNSSMLYRYLSLHNVGDKKLLLDKALQSLALIEPSKPFLQWNDFRNLDFITAKALAGAGRWGNALQQSYDASAFAFEFDGNSLEIHALPYKQKEIPALAGLLPWHNMQIYLHDRIKPIRENEKDLLEYHKFWKEIETKLCDTEAYMLTPQKRQAMAPGVGDEVTVIVTKKLDESGLLFECKIQDPIYEGAGVIYTKDIIGYDLRTNEKSFQNDEGKWLKLKATVKEITPDGSCRFAMTEQVKKFVRTEYSKEDSMLCKVNSTDKKRPDTLLCVSEFGISTKVKCYDSQATAEIPKGSFIWVAYENLYDLTGCIWAHYCEPAETGFDLNSGFGDLMFNLTDEVFDPDTTYEPLDTEQQQINMDETYIYEIVRIIDLMAVHETDYVATYNYLSFARLLTLMIGDTDKAKLYEKRLKLLQMLQHYADNKTDGKTILKELQEISDAENKHDRMFTNNQQLQTRIYELKLMAYLGYEEKNSEIVEIMNLETTDSHLRGLCQLAYSYNLLSGFRLLHERESIRRKFYEKLGFTNDYKERICYGEEGQKVEFKTSTVFPPENNMRPDVERQTHNILKAICGFLNAGGGTLYIGVNNDGLASGLDNDIAYLGSYDKFNLHIHNAIAHFLGNEVDYHIKEEWLHDEDKRVYKLTIPASSQPVLLEGVKYRRQSSCTRVIND